MHPSAHRKSPNMSGWARKFMLAGHPAMSAIMPPMRHEDWTYIAPTFGGVIWCTCRSTGGWSAQLAVFAAATSAVRCMGRQHVALSAHARKCTGSRSWLKLWASALPIVLGIPDRCDASCPSALSQFPRRLVGADWGCRLGLCSAQAAAASELVCGCSKASAAEAAKPRALRRLGSGDR